MHGERMPGEAPPVIWLAMIAAMAIWWLWPWMERLRKQASPAAIPTPAVPYGAPHERDAAVDDSTTAGTAQVQNALSAAVPAVQDDQQEQVISKIDFDLLGEFRNAFNSAAQHIGNVLNGPPSGKEYTSGVAALHHMSEILDRVFKAFGSPEELAKVTRLREASDAFRRSFGDHRIGESMRGLLQDAGFEPQGLFSAEEADGHDGAWVFNSPSAQTRLRGLTVRLCLLKLTELQRLRGPGRWNQANNSAVVPSLENASFMELVDLYSEIEGTMFESRPSMRERNLEANIRIAICTRRSEHGLKEPLTLHKGLASVARALADERRVQARQDRNNSVLVQPSAQVASDIQKRLATLPVPPGFSVAHLHWSSTELPRLFGLASTKGGAGGGRESEGTDEAADILAREAVGFWAARQQADLFWPASTVCGVGAALDYTMNKGFVIVLLLGFEPQLSSGDSSAETESISGLFRRPAAARAAKVKSSAGPAPPPRSSLPAQKRVVGFGDLPSAPRGG